MNCNWVKQNASMYLYNELADDARHEFERHIERCADCAQELNEVREFSTMMDTMPVVEPSANLLAASRMRLQEALEHTEQVGAWRKYIDISAWFNQVKFAPALATLLFAVGFGGGTYTTYAIMQNGGGNSVIPTVVQPSGEVATASIAGIRAIQKDAATNKVTIQYDTLAPQTVEASVDDPRVQQLLLFAAKNNNNSGVRMDSVNLLTANPDQEPVRQALMFSLKYDTNPGVRLKALEGLGPYVKDDIAVRDAVVESLLNDQNAGVRTMAIQLLNPVKADGSVRSTLEMLAQRDQNQFIRSESRRMVASLPEID